MLSNFFGLLRCTFTWEQVPSLTKISQSSDDIGSTNTWFKDETWWHGLRKPWKKPHHSYIKICSDHIFNANRCFRFVLWSESKRSRKKRLNLFSICQAELLSQLPTQLNAVAIWAGGHPVLSPAEEHWRSIAPGQLQGLVLKQTRSMCAPANIILLKLMTIQICLCVFAPQLLLKIW